MTFEDFLKTLLKRRILHTIDDVLDDYPVATAFAYIDGKVQIDIQGRDDEGNIIFYFRFPIRVGFRVRTKEELDRVRAEANTITTDEPLLVCYLWGLNLIPIEELVKI